jgi:tetratricopeptide (TPR) repeat protein
MAKRIERVIGNVSRAARLADDIIRQGMDAIERHRPIDAERMARDVLGRHPRHRGALQLLGLALLGQNRTRDALPPLEQAARDSGDPVAETRFARALREFGRHNDAFEWLERATARLPPFAAAFHELGVLLCLMRRYADAETVLKRGIEVAPDAVELSVELGGVYIFRADPANAKLAFARALAQSPGHLRALHGFGTACLFDGEFQRAADRFRQVIAHAPEHVRARLDFAHALLELRRFDEAVEALRKLVYIAPQYRGRALKLLVSSGRGRLWLRPSVAAHILQSSKQGRELFSIAS